MKHLKSRNRHSKAFRTQAVELLLTGRTLGELGAEHGGSTPSISHNTSFVLELNRPTKFGKRQAKLGGCS